MYALRDALGENQVNQALSQYIDQMAFQEPPYTVSTDLFDLLKDQITEPWQQAMLSDSFEHITLYSNEVIKASYSTLENGRTEVELTVLARKYQANGQGIETEVPLDDWIDIGLFADDDAQEILVLEKRHLTAHETTFKFVVDTPPVRAGIDPYHKLIDRETNDNLKKVENRSSAPSKVARLSP